jgi:hypothetical protein
VGIFRKKETLNEQLLREAGLDRVVINTPTPIDAGPLPPATGDPSRLTRLNENPNRARAWDAVMTVAAPGMPWEHVDFIALPNGDLLLGETEEDGDLSPLADAIEEHISPPYKASASRQEGDLWGVGACRIEVAEFAFPDADSLALAQRDGGAEFDVDGKPSDATVPPELWRLGERVDGDFCVAAGRIDGDYWEVLVAPL